MAYQPLVINNFREGLVRSVDSFLLSNDASPDLVNASYFRGRIVERGGSRLFAKNTEAFRGRLGARTFSSTTNSSGEIDLGVIFTDAALSPSTVLITQGALQLIDDGLGDFIDYNASGWTGIGSIDYTTATITAAVTGLTPSTAYSVYMLREIDAYSPAMGLFARELSLVNSYELFAFDRLKPYRFSDALDRFSLIDSYSGSANLIDFSGTDSEFFWCSNYKNGFWATNNVAGFNAQTDITAVVTGGATTITFNTSHSFEVGDAVFLWDLKGVTLVNTSASVTSILAANQIVVSAVSSGTWTSGGTVTAINKKIGSGDGIKFYDQTGWRNFNPPLTGQNPPTQTAAATYLFGALIILPYKGFLLTLGTWEGSTYANRVNYQQRARWCQNGTPYYASPAPTNEGFDPLAWLQATGRGGFIDAPTQEQIVSAEFIRDTLVVFFETSVWVLDFTEDLYLPFIWRQVNKDYGSQSTFSTLSFDKKLLSIAVDGVIATDGVNLERIDQKIPDIVYDIAQTNSAEARVHGRIDFVSQNCAWCYPDTKNSPLVVYPNKELFYNYLDGSWTVHEAFATCYVKYTRFFNLSWREASFSWASANFTWNSLANQTGDTVTLSGNAQGFIHVLQLDQINGPSFNQQQFRVSSVSANNLVIKNHSFTTGQFIYLTGMSGDNATYNDVVYKIVVISATQIRCIDSGGDIALFENESISTGFVAHVPNMVITSKRFYAGNNVGQQSRLGYIDLLFEPSANEQSLNIDLYIDESATPSQSKSFSIASVSGSVQQKVMRRIYFNSMGTSFQFQIYYPDNEMFNFNSGNKQFVLHQATLWYKTSARMVRQPQI